MRTNRSGAMAGVGMIVGAVLALSPVAAAPAFAGVVGTVVPLTHQPVKVGETFTGALTITNFSKAPNAGHVIDVSDIFFTPSCTAVTGGTCASADIGALSISNAKGVATTACEGISFSLGAPNRNTGEIQFVPSSAIKLGPVDLSGPPTICRIQFDVKVLKLPQHAMDARMANAQPHVMPSGSPVAANHVARARFTDATTKDTIDATGSRSLTVSAP